MMKHKSIRIIYMIAVYILAAPLSALMLLWWFIWMGVITIRDKYNFDEIKDLIGAYLEGLRVGHATNMRWVKYGNPPYDSNEWGRL